MSGGGKLTVISKDKIVYLKGDLSEGASFSSLIEAFRSEVLGVDFKGVSSSSWNGILKINSIVQDGVKVKPLKILNFSYDVYRFFRMLSDFSDNYSVESVELKVFKSDELGLSCTNNNFTKVDFEQQGTLANGRFLQRNDSRQILGRAVFHNSISSCFEGPRSYENINDLVHDYGLFVDSIVSLAIDLSIGLVQSMGRINRELEGMLDTTEKFLKIFEKVVPAEFLELHTISRGLIARLESRSERIVSDLSQMAAEVISIAACAQINLGLDKAPDAEASELLSKLSLLITSADAASQRAEDLGVETGSLFAYFKVISSGRELMEGLDGSEVAADRITSLIDVFGIMDPTADDWPQLIPHINDYFSECESELSRLSAVSQSCDLMRQILEHRIKEAVLIKSYVDNFSGDIALPENLSMLKVELFDLIVKKMVTDQEKFAALFYLNLSSKAEDESSATPGDMLLF